VKKVENGVCVFCKKVDLSSMQGSLCTVSVFFILHFTNLGEGTYAPNAPPVYRPAMLLFVASPDVNRFQFFSALNSVVNL